MATKREIARRRKESQRDVAPPSLPPAPPKGKVGDAAKTELPRTKEPLGGGRKVKG